MEWKQSIFFVLPELYLSICILFIVLYGVWLSTSKKLGFPIIIEDVMWLAVWVLICTSVLLFSSVGVSSGTVLNQLDVSVYTQMVKLLVILISIPVLLSSISYVSEEKINEYEYVVFVLLAILSLFFLVSASNLLVVFLGLELQALCFYILAAFNRNQERSVEAGLKYFIYSAFVSGLFLFGVALIYLMTNTIQLEKLAMLLVMSYPSSFLTTVSPVLVLGFFFIFISFFFKLYIAPFHVWAPDVYSGSPLSVVAVFASIPLLGVGSFFCKFYVMMFIWNVRLWLSLFVVCCVLSMIVGGFGAIRQKVITRMLAYSSIHHAGFYGFLLGFGTLSSMRLFFTYSLVYILTNICFFTCLLSLRKLKGTESTGVMYISDLKGIAKSSPVLAAVLSICLLSMAGIPPLAGFFTKLYVFSFAIQHQAFVFVLVGIITSALSAYYYLNCIKTMYFEDVESQSTYKEVPVINSIILLTTCGVIVSFIGVSSLFEHLVIRILS